MFLAIAVIIGGNVIASELEGFTEPYRQVAVPAAEIGVLAEILVAEGDQVSQQQLLAKLDDSVLQASLEVARAAKDAMGSRRGAEVELGVRETQRESYRDLHEQGNASQREIDRIESECQQAAARLQTVREELEIRRLEFERVKSQIRQRRIESPINGHVIAIVKEAGEFVSPTDPVVMHIAQLDILKAVFSVPIEAATELKPNQTVTLLVGSDRVSCQGTIEFVSPTADAQSASVRVKIRIPNTNGNIPSGAACQWDLDQLPADSQQRVTTRPAARNR
jgi:RND family efflux transporter MFP subunit